MVATCLKSTDVTHLHKKGKKDLKEKYRPFTILPVLSKVFERTMFVQMSFFSRTFYRRNNSAFEGLQYATLSFGLFRKTEMCC